MKKSKMKPVTVNFVLVFILIIIFFILALFFSGKIASAQRELEEMKNSINELRNNGEVSDVEGYALIGHGLGYIIESFGIAIFKLVEWFLMIYGGILLFFSGIARFVYGPSKGRILCYRILMGITYLFIALWMFIYAKFFSFGDSSLLFWLFVAVPELALFLILFFNMRNTYSKRIYPPEFLEQLQGKESSSEVESFDRVNLIPIIRASICNGEQVAGFKNIHTGHFEEIMLIRNDGDKEIFLKKYGIDPSELKKEW